ncbi:hypothetical protein M6I34_06740 [Burkholderiaceae bacterium FT117]|uniref:hypothetical protein n=1 Tax=Zeimonas sediminis TaxID=2944268 RepID=UPI002342D3B4|nr:hypothetical protein [Zeimonas sediminis]MCM5570199.1 hypothetical protein [Zeimonas sediminis]
MKVRVYAIWRVVPVPFVILPRLPGRIAGISLGMVVLLRREYGDDWPTVVHELEHCRQFWRGGTVLHLVRYLVDPRYRLRSEVGAYRAELAACLPSERRGRLYDSAHALANGYGLGIDARSCRRLLDAGHASPAPDRALPGAGFAARPRRADTRPR